MRYTRFKLIFIIIVGFIVLCNTYPAEYYDIKLKLLKRVDLNNYSTLYNNSIALCNTSTNKLLYLLDQPVAKYSNIILVYTNGIESMGLERTYAYRRHDYYVKIGGTNDCNPFYSFDISGCYSNYFHEFSSADDHSVFTSNIISFAHIYIDINIDFIALPFLTRYKTNAIVKLIIYSSTNNVQALK